jgi:glutathione synthase/RimK-type ligase-like ATP-grasp enzyme
MIGEKITEVNITSPTCIAEINKFHNLNLGEIFWKDVL